MNAIKKAAKGCANAKAAEKGYVPLNPDAVSIAATAAGPIPGIKPNIVFHLLFSRSINLLKFLKHLSMWASIIKLTLFSVKCTIQVLYSLLTATSMIDATIYFQIF
jgi:hypothetical protein